MAEILTVKSLTGEQHELKKYTEQMDADYQEKMKKTIGIGIGAGGVISACFATVVLCVWFGAKCVAGE